MGPSIEANVLIDPVFSEPGVLTGLSVDCGNESTNSIEEGVHIIKRAVKEDLIFVGFSLETFAWHLKKEHDLNIRRVLDVACFLRFLGYVDIWPNAVRLSGRTEGSDTLSVLQNLFEKMTQSKFRGIEACLARRTHEENLHGIKFDRDAALECQRRWGREKAELAYQENSQAEQDQISERLRTITRLLEIQDRLYFTNKYFGNRTGRYTSGTRKVHVDCNLAGIDFLRLPGDVRRFFIPDSDESWVSSDASNIDPRSLAFLAQDQKMLKLFQSGQDIYLRFARWAFPDKVVEKNGRNTHLRDVAKMAVISIGYGITLMNFKKKVLEAAPEASSHEIELAYDRFDFQFRKIKPFREKLFKAFCHTFEDGKVRRVNKVRIIRCDELDDGAYSIEIQLPTGRSIFYRGIKRKKVLRFGKPTTVYKFAEAYRIGEVQNRIPIYPQRLVHNITQAVSRDVIEHQRRGAESLDGLIVRFGLHDELVASCRECQCPGKKEHLPDCQWVAAGEKLQKVMSTVPSTLPGLNGLRLGAEWNKKVRNRWGK
ncbi:MAG: hypothetical protein GY847_41955 [Proteobacteria bacterium]|nr:hypothetical protein [Pseudomonadota bacterium]